MDITITIADQSLEQIMLSIAAANGWPRAVTADTVERVTQYMMRTVAQWTAGGAATLAREAEEAAALAAVAESVKIAVK